MLKVAVQLAVPLALVTAVHSGRLPARPVKVMVCPEIGAPVVLLVRAADRPETCTPPTPAGMRPAAAGAAVSTVVVVVTVCIVLPWLAALFASPL